MQSRQFSGFTLIEALVAVAMLALLFGALMPVFHNGLAVLQSGERHTRAVLLARSVMEQQRVAAVLPASVSADPGADEGQMEDFRWRIMRSPFIDDRSGDDTLETAQTGASANADEDAPFTLQQISVVVFWPQNESGVQLHSLVLVAKP